MNSILIKDNQNRTISTLFGINKDLDNINPNYQEWLKKYYNSGIIMPSNKITKQNSARGSSFNFIKVGDPNFLECLVIELRESKFAKDNNLQIYYEDN